MSKNNAEKRSLKLNICQSPTCFSDPKRKTTRDVGAVEIRVGITITIHPELDGWMTPAKKYV